MGGGAGKRGSEKYDPESGVSASDHADKVGEQDDPLFALRHNKKQKEFFQKTVEGHRHKVPDWHPASTQTAALKKLEKRNKANVAEAPPLEESVPASPFRRGSVDMEALSPDGSRPGSPDDGSPRSPGARRGSVDSPRSPGARRGSVDASPRSPGGRRGSVDASPRSPGGRRGSVEGSPGARRGSMSPGGQRGSISPGARRGSTGIQPASPMGSVESQLAELVSGKASPQGSAVQMDLASPSSRKSPQARTAKELAQHSWLDDVQVTALPSSNYYATPVCTSLVLQSPTSLTGGRTLLEGALESVDLRNPSMPKAPFYSSRMAWQLVDAADEE